MKTELKPVQPILSLNLQNLQDDSFMGHTSFRQMQKKNLESTVLNFLPGLQEKPMMKKYYPAIEEIFSMIITKS